jgi:hypothetical protein
MMNRPGSATNLKASQSTLPPARVQTQCPDTNMRISGDITREEQIPCLSLNHYKSNPARVNCRSLENSDLSPLANKEGRAPQYVASLAALDLLGVKKSG